MGGQGGSIGDNRVFWGPWGFHREQWVFGGGHRGSIGNNGVLGGYGGSIGNNGFFGGHGGSIRTMGFLGGPGGSIGNNGVLGGWQGGFWGSHLLSRICLPLESV